MWKLKSFAIITIILGVISLGWIIYDYMALTDIVYNVEGDLIGKRRMVTLGFIPIMLFHFSFFATMYLLFDYLKQHKLLLKDYNEIKTELEAQKPGSRELKAKEVKAKDAKDTDIDITEGSKPVI